MTIDEIEIENENENEYEYENQQPTTGNWQLTK